MRHPMQHRHPQVAEAAAAETSIQRYQVSNELCAAAKILVIKASTSPGIIDR